MKIVLLTIGSRGDVSLIMQPPEMRQKSAELVAAIRAEPDGVMEAVRLIEGAV
ncbi:MAG: hypothetical protein NZP74_14350 [Anaerolineales bacterium]|nr:hypothetical protein [Anaerolineales bacterium]